MGRFALATVRARDYLREVEDGNHLPGHGTIFGRLKMVVIFGRWKMVVIFGRLKMVVGCASWVYSSTYDWVEEKQTNGGR
jgi:hypothetical protein